MSVVVGSGFAFALPPSLGREPVRDLARHFADVLYGAGFTAVVPCKTYEELETALLDGEVHAAWGPPLVCGKVEAAGGAVLRRAIRHGTTSYRSALVCRSHDDIDLQRLGQPGARRIRAVWTDEWSMGGRILARHYLRSIGVDLAAAFSEEYIAGNYQDCFEQVLDGEADLTASFAGPRGLGYVDIVGANSFMLRTLAYSSPCPNDGIVLSPRLGDRGRTKIEEGLAAITAAPKKLEVLTSMFNVDGFDQPPAGHYAPLLELR